MLSVIMPMYRSKFIGWLGLESLCHQKDINFEWELIIAEENGKSFLEFGLENILTYKEGLKKVGCKQVKYLKLNHWIPLSMKYSIMAEQLNEDSKVFLIQQTDYWSPLYRMSKTFELMQNADWVHGKTFIMYDMKRDEIHLRTKNPIKFWMAVNTDLAKNLPPSLKKKGVDQYLLDSCKKIKKSKLKCACCQDWGEGLVVHGLNNLSNNFKKFRAAKSNIKLENILPDDIIKKLSLYKKEAGTWKINIPHFKKAKLTTPDYTLIKEGL